MEKKKENEKKGLNLTIPGTESSLIPLKPTELFAPYS